MSDIFVGVAATTFAGSAILLWLWKLSASQLWGLFYKLQLVIHLAALKIVMPANAKVFFHHLIAIAMFDILPTDIWFPEWFNFSPESKGIPSR